MSERVLLNFSVTKLEDMVEKGNAWYSTHYLEHFDKYVCAYLLGDKANPVQRGGVFLVPLGTGRPLLDLVMAPWRVHRLSVRMGATHFISADLILAWWHSWIIRLVARARVTVMPVCNPEEILGTSGRTYSGLPAPLERVLIGLSFFCAHRILCVRTDASGIAWVRTSRFQHKLKIVEVMPEDLSPPEFGESLRSQQAAAQGTGRAGEKVSLVFVGRLEKEKLVDDLIEAMIQLKQLRKPFVLTIVGDGGERRRLEARVRAADLNDSVIFVGFLPSKDVARCLSDAEIFVSPYTGTALREAAAAGLAIVAYRLGGIEQLFTEGEDCLLAEPGDSVGLAKHIAELIDHPGRRADMALKARRLAGSVWSTGALRSSLKEAFAYDA